PGAGQGPQTGVGMVALSFATALQHLFALAAVQSPGMQPAACLPEGCFDGPSTPETPPPIVPAVPLRPVVPLPEAPPAQQVRFPSPSYHRLPVILLTFFTALGVALPWTGRGGAGREESDRDKRRWPRRPKR